VHATDIGSKEPRVTRYLVKFFKKVVGENGHESEACQGTFEVSACNADGAAEHGKRAFCEREQLAHWSFHADRVTVAETEFPS
jgi:hypothetical protein